MIAFGGVATGSINAHDAAIVAGIIISKGFVLIALEKPAITGRITWADAVLEANSVNIATPIHIKPIKI